MNKLLYGLILLLLSIQNVQGHLHEDDEPDQPYNKDAEPYEAVEHEEEYQGCGGYLRAGYIQSSIGSNTTLSANAIGGELGCGYAFNKHIKAHLGLFAAIDTGLNRSDDNSIQGDFFNRKKDSYLLLGEAVLTLNFDKFEAHLGRQNVDTPHMDTDDLRLIANFYEAYLIDYHASEQLYFGAGFVRQMSGWENGADPSEFVGIGDAFGGNGDASWISWLAYEQDQISSNLWYYLIPDHLHIFYAEFIYSDQINQALSYRLGLQYDWGEQTGAAKLGSVQANTWGLLASLSGFDITATFAYNRNHNTYSAIPSLGGGPFFTSMEDQTLDAVSGEDASAILLGLEYSPLSSITLGVVGGKFRAHDKTQYDIEEINFYLNFNWQQSTTLELMYANLDNKNTLQSEHQFRAILSYRY